MVIQTRARSGWMLVKIRSSRSPCDGRVGNESKCSRSFRECSERLTPRFLDRPEACEVDSPFRGVPIQQRQHEADGTLGIAAHDLVHAQSQIAVVLGDPFQAIFERTIADVFVIRGVNLFLRHQE